MSDKTFTCKECKGEFNEEWMLESHICPVQDADALDDVTEFNEELSHKFDMFRDKEAEWDLALDEDAAREDPRFNIFEKLEDLAPDKTPETNTISDDGTWNLDPIPVMAEGKGFDLFSALELAHALDLLREVQRALNTVPQFNFSSPYRNSYNLVSAVDALLRRVRNTATPFPHLQPLSDTVTRQEMANEKQVDHATEAIQLLMENTKSPTHITLLSDCLMTLKRLGRYTVKNDRLMEGLDQYLNNYESFEISDKAEAGRQARKHLHLALDLYHGREDPEQSMDDWGSEGPVFLNIEYLHMAYLSEPNMGGEIEGFLSLTPDKDLIFYDGVYYGDFSVFIYDDENEEMVKTYGSRITEYDHAKAKLDMKDSVTPHLPNMWSDSMAKLAFAEGWNVFQVLDGGPSRLAIQKWDTAERFASDADALAWVEAHSDMPHCAQALAINGKEVMRIKGTTK